MKEARQFLPLVSCFQLGVNGYSFAVNNNGYVLYHPDLRPMVRINNEGAKNATLNLLAFKTTKTKLWHFQATYIPYNFLFE